MSTQLIFKRSLLTWTAALWTAIAGADTELTLTPVKPTAIYEPGESIVWQVKVRGDASEPIHQAAYVLKKGGGTVIGKGTLVLKDGTGSIQTSLDGSGTILAEVTATDAHQQTITALGGAAIAPEKIQPSVPCPDDFDKFWKSELDELAAVPEHPVLESGVSGAAGVDYWKTRPWTSACRQ